MTSAPPRSNHRRDDERGATFIVVAISLVMLIGACALSVDVGRVVDLNRSLQTVADAGALDAARYLDVAGESNALLTAQAQDAATNNGSNATMTAIQGTWSRAGGFTPGAGQYVEVTASSTLKHLFEPGSSSLSRTAVAEATNPDAGFSIGTYLASFDSQDSDILNPLLSALGASVDISAIGYQGMANTDMTIQQIINASGGVLTPTNVLNTSLSARQWQSIFGSADETVSEQPALSSTIDASLCQMVSINGSTCSTTLSSTALSASVNVLQTLTTEAELANGNNALSVGASLGGLTTLKVTLGQIPQVAYGPIGTRASTGQVDVTLTIAGIVSSLTVTGATGTATFTADTCNDNAMTTQLTANTSSASIKVTALLGLETTTTVSGVSNDALTFDPPPPSSQTVGTTNPSIDGLTGGLTAAVLDPLFESLGVSLANANVTDLSASSCSPVQLVQ
ncbi:MAG: pilus assembly protein TadG-related protein [Acidimicrobiales bacterium]